MRTRTLTAFAGLLFALPTVAAAVWLPMTMAELLAQSDLVVAGKIVSIQRGPVAPDATDQAEIKLAEVFKGWPAGTKVFLRFPSRQRGTVDEYGQVQSTASLSDVYYEQDQEGIWFLKATKTPGIYVAPHPARFRPLFFRSQILEAIVSAQP